MDIIDLTSLAWSDEERYSLVGHSFRVMAKAKNFDETVVGMMHAFYAASSYTRSLYHCDVAGDPEWKTALDLFIPPLKMKRFRSKETIPDDYLLSLNMPQNLSDAERSIWMKEQTVWSKAYADYIWKIGRNRIARNVMIHKLEDMIDVLENPGKYECESGRQYYVLPWKWHQVVDVSSGSVSLSQSIPHTDDSLLLRELTENERESLIDNYSRALMDLELVEYSFPVLDSYSKKMHEENETRFHKWFLLWMDSDRALNGRYVKEGEDDGDSDQDLPF
jgi:hypothetical protein